MQGFILSVASNVAVAGALALLALGVTSIWRNPHLAHALWLLVLLKLVTPPIVQAPLPQSLLTSAGENRMEDADLAMRSPASAALGEPGDAASAVLLGSGEAASTARVEPPDAVSTLPYMHMAARLGGIVWLTGALAWLRVFLRRYLRFRRLLVASTEADSQLLDEARRLARVVGLARCPAVRVVDARIPPLVWSMGHRPVVLLPLPVWARLDAAQRETVLLHELAHVRRRDHCVRWFELLVMVLYWWNPIVWCASRQIRQAEEECCDAWVVWALPECRRSYGQALLQTVEFLTESRAVPAIVGNAFGGFLFKRRIEMILKRSMNPKMSWLMWATVLLLAAIVLPVTAQQPGNEKTPATSERQETFAPLASPKSADDKTTDAVRAKADRAASGKPLEKSRLPKVSSDYRPETRVAGGVVTGGGIVERTEDDRIYLRSGDYFSLNERTRFLLVPARGGVRQLEPTAIEPGMAVSYSMLEGKINRLILHGIVEDADRGEGIFEVIKQRNLKRLSQLSDSIDDRYPLQLIGKDGEVLIRKGETKLVELPKPTTEVQWRQGDYKPEVISDIEQFDFLLIQWRDTGRLTWTCYQSSPSR